ncbi:MAG TPA: endoribonuclease MazF [Thermoanaerobaculia bacterium]|nr:endoribonuclease MazF [Thermoanaerobaculia bacterium]
MAKKPGKARYIPDRGDAVWLTFDPQAGHEQSGRRPAVVLSPKMYNSRTDLAVFCPITSQVKGYPFEVLLPEALPVRGAVLADQLKSLDWRIRKAEFICALPETTVRLVLQKSSLLLAQIP